MASTDWTLINDALSAGSVARGVTAGVPRPNGGGSFVYGMATLDTSPGVVALFTNQANFAPMAKGVSVRGCLKRGISGGPLNFAPFLFGGLQGPTSADAAYLLGLSDSDPYRIVLRKGSLAGGLPDALIQTPPLTGVLAKSSGTFALDTWLHIRLDVICNTNGDVVLNAYQNSLADHPCTAPVWDPIDGLDMFIDDALGVNTGSAPLVGGRAGFGTQTKDVTRRCYFDQLEVARQL